MDLRHRTSVGLALLSSVLMSLLGTGPLRAQIVDGAALVPSTMLIFDGSGSMWGKLEGEKPTKFVQARDAIRTALGKVAPQSTNVGLMSYGHRRPADCSDVQVIAQPDAAAGPAFIDRIAAPLEKLNPKGKGPLTAALREAAKLVGKSTGPRSIVLIHDDPDNCQQDACATLAEIQQSAPGVVIHVVGLGLKPEDATRYQCLTTATGGRHIDAQDGPKATDGIGDVLALALQGGRDADRVQAPASATPTAAEPPKAPEIATREPKPIIRVTNGAPALRLRALLAKDVGLAEHRVRWSIWPDPSADSVKVTATAEGIEATVPIAAGAYRVRAETGFVSADRLVSVASEGETVVEAVFDAAEMRLKTPLAADATLLINQRTTPADAKAPVRRIGIWPHGQTAVLVPGGTLVLQLEQAELRSERLLETKAGQTLNIEMAQPGGRVMLDLLPPVGSVPPVGTNSAQPITIFTISEDDPDAPRGRRELARSAARSAEFVVAPGSYTVAATRGALETRERVTVVAGEAVRRSLPLVAARLAISARLGQISEPVSTGVAADSFRIMRLDAVDAPAVLLSGPAAIADLPPGRYRVEARRNAAAISAHQDVEIKVGEYRVVTLDYQAGGVRLEALLKAGASQQGIAWMIMDDAGRLVWSSTEPAPSTLLSVGRYVVRMTIRGARYEVAVDIQNGDITTVRLGQP